MPIYGQSAAKLGKTCLSVVVAFGGVVRGFAKTIARTGIVGQRISGEPST